MKPIRASRWAAFSEEARMLAYDFESSLGYWITITSHHYQQQLDRELAPFEITFRQFQVVGWLVLAGPLTPAELARRLMVERPTLTGLLDRMEREGWVRRKNCDVDGRKRRVELQPDASSVWSQIVGCLQRVRLKAVQGLTRDEQETLTTLLQKVLHNLEPELAPVCNLPT